jgi:hypothetical protein
MSRENSHRIEKFILEQRQYHGEPAEFTGKPREFALSSGAAARLFLLMVKFCFKVSSGTKVDIFLQLPRDDESEVRVPTE